MIDLKERRKALKEKIRHAYDSIEFITAEDKDLLDEIISEVSSLVKAEKQAEIEALKAQLEQSEKVWISVDFMLPDIEQEVLLLYKSNVIQGGRFNIREDSDEYSHEWEWWCELLDTWGLDQNRVSHWMPLPKGQGDAE